MQQTATDVTVPATLADGNQAVIATVAGVSSQSSALLKVAASAKLALLNRKRVPFRQKNSIEHVAWLAALNDLKDREGCLVKLS